MVKATPRKRVHETVATFIRRTRPRVSSRAKQLPDWVFSWWFALAFVLVMIVLPVTVMIVLTFPS